MPSDNDYFPHPTVRGRGAAENPRNRFENMTREALPPEDWQEPETDPRTEYIPDHSRSAITTNDSPDIGFSASLNPYRGCEHGCAYCYARPTHEYLGFSAGIDFETRIMVKYDAPEMLRKELASPRWQPQTLVMSGVTDCYQPVEKRLEITRRCLMVLAECRNPVAIITKNALVARDVDIYAAMAAEHTAAVNVSITSLDADFARRLEPRTSTPRAKLAAIEKLAGAGVPVGVIVAPVIPGLNDHEIPAILQAAAQAGARRAGYVVLRLPHGLKELFADWLERHEPGRKEKVLNRLREMHGGKLYHSAWGKRGRGEGPWAEELKILFQVARRRAGLDGEHRELSIEGFRRPAQTGPGQLELF